MSKLTVAQHIALGTFLSDYDESASLEDNLSKLLNGVSDEEEEDDIIVGVAEAYENLDESLVADSIVSLAESIQNAINSEMKK